MINSILNALSKWYVVYFQNRNDDSSDPRANSLNVLYIYVKKFVCYCEVLHVNGCFITEGWVDSEQVCVRVCMKFVLLMKSTPLMLMKSECNFIHLVCFSSLFRNVNWSVVFSHIKGNRLTKFSEWITVWYIVILLCHSSFLFVFQFVLLRNLWRRN